MLPSPNKWAQHFRDFFTEKRVGVSLRTRHLCTAEILKTSSGPFQTNGNRYDGIPVRVFSSRPSDEHRELLVRSFENIRRSLKSPEIQLAVPPPMLIETVFRLEKKPRTRRSMNLLLAWRIEQELQMDLAGMRYDWQSFRCSRNGCSVLVSLASSEWLEMLEGAASEAGVVVGVIDSATHYYLNYLFRWVTGEAGGFVQITEDSWAVVFWDEHLSPSYTKARWRDTGVSRQDVVREVERIIIAYEQGQNKLLNIYGSGLTGDDISDSLGGMGTFEGRYCADWHGPLNIQQSINGDETAMIEAVLSANPR